MWQCQEGCFNDELKTHGVKRASFLEKKTKFHVFLSWCMVLKTTKEGCVYKVK